MPLRYLAIDLLDDPMLIEERERGRSPKNIWRAIVARRRTFGREADASDSMFLLRETLDIRCLARMAGRVRRHA